MVAFDIQSRVFLLRLPLALSKDLGPMIKPRVALVVKNLLANAGDARDVSSHRGLEEPLEKEVATLSSILAWGIPWTEKPGELQSMGLQRVRHH